MTAWNKVIGKYISFFEKRGHKRIPNAPLIPENDPTTLFTSSGMQPLVPYLLGEAHPQGKRLVNVQNCFRAQDIDEIGDNRHTTFFRMLGNWSLGDPARNASASVAGGYFKKEQLPWFFEFLTKDLGLDAKRLYVSIFQGYKNIPKDEEAAQIWRELFASVGIDSKDRIFYYGVEENWWSRTGTPENMPAGEPGGPDSEVFFDFYPEQGGINNDLKKYSRSGRLLEIGNSVFMQYQKLTGGGFKELPQKNVDFGGGLERLLSAVEGKQDIFTTSLFLPIIKSIEKVTGKAYEDYKQQMRIISDHFVASCFMIAEGVTPSNKEHGYVLRRLIRRALDNAQSLGKFQTSTIIDSIIEQYQDTDPKLLEQFEKISLIMAEEENVYRTALKKAKKLILEKYGGERIGDELMGVTKISPDDAFMLYATHGLSPTQIKNLGFIFDEKSFAEKMEEHQRLSRIGAQKKFAGGLADHSSEVIKGHTATHLLHQALRDVLGSHIHQTGSNITAERIRFDFSYDKQLTESEIKKVEKMVNQKIEEDLPVHFEIMPVTQAKKLGAIGLFNEKYGDKVKIYFMGNYSVEFCGGPHVKHTKELKKFKILKEEGLGKNNRRVYCIVE